MRPNANVLAGVPSIDGYDGGVQITERWADALRRFQPDPPIDLPLRNSLTLPIEPEPLARLGVRYILLDNKRPPDVFIPGWDGPLASDDNCRRVGEPGLARRRRGLAGGDRVRRSRRTAPRNASGRGARSDRGRVPTTPSSAAARRPSASRSGSPPTAPARSRSISPSTCDRPSLVSVTQQALPGWTVEVDGNDAEVVVVDGLFLGVHVPAGDHTVTFQYRSPWLRVVTGDLDAWRWPRPSRSASAIRFAGADEVLKLRAAATDDRLTSICRSESSPSCVPDSRFHSCSASPSG